MLSRTFRCWAFNMDCRSVEASTKAVLANVRSRTVFRDNSTSHPAGFQRSARRTGSPRAFTIRIHFCSMNSEPLSGLSLCLWRRPVAAMPPKVQRAWPEAINQMMFVEMIQKPLPTPAVKEEPVQEEDEEARSVLNEQQAPEEKEEEEDEDAMSVLNEQQARTRSSINCHG